MNKFVKIGRGRELNSGEVHAILKLYEGRYSATKMTKIVERSREVITNLLKDFDNYGKGRSCGRSQCVTARDTVPRELKLD